MYPIEFNKTRAEETLSAIQKGRPIPEPPDGWTSQELLQVAGVCFSLAFLMGPAGMESGVEAMETWLMKRQEAAEDELSKELHDALDFYSAFVYEMLVGDYDEHHGLIIDAMIIRDEDGPRILFSD